jgi:hypothetical protein
MGAQAAIPIPDRRKKPRVAVLAARAAGGVRAAAVPGSPVSPSASNEEKRTETCKNVQARAIREGERRVPRLRRSDEACDDPGHAALLPDDR